MKSLLSKTLMQFIICAVILLLIATPLFYFLVEHYYAEDLIEIMNAAEQGKPLPPTDLEEDLMIGVVYQFVLIAGVLSISLVLMMRLISKRLWVPFDDTLHRIEQFSLEGENIPQFMQSDIKEFTRLNNAITQLMKKNLESYKSQKEFTENASHELQTPLAVFQSKLDLLLQQSEMTKEQAEIVQTLYEVTNRLSRLNRNLLLLTRIDNHQYNQVEQIDAVQTLRDILPLMNKLTEGITVYTDLEDSSMFIQANQSLLESLINNLIVNAVRHNIKDGNIFISIKERQLIIANTSAEGELQEKLLFTRFYRPSEKIKGNGLGLAIAKAICEYHGWSIHYTYKKNMHRFTVFFGTSNQTSNQ